MPQSRRRLRLTIAMLMGLVALAALVLVVLTPLVRYGVPPCQTHMGTLRWLLAGPGNANCNACHATPTFADPPAQRIAKLLADTPFNAHSQGDRQSCLKCHSIPSS